MIHLELMIFKLMIRMRKVVIPRIMRKDWKVNVKIYQKNRLLSWKQI